MSKYSHTVVRDMLSKQVLEVSFTKADGSARVMICTTNGNMIPHADRPAPSSEKSARQEPTETFRVYDLEKKAWRSFRLDSVHRIDIIHNQDEYRVD